MNKLKQKNYSIEFLRFFFAIAIVYFHIFSNIAKYVNWDLYESFAQKSSNAERLVEAFLIIAGFFMFFSINTKKQTIGQFFIDKFVRLWPVFALATILCVIIGKFDGYYAFLNLSMLYSIGFTPKVLGITWFIPPFFWAMIFYFYIIKNFNSKHLNFIIILMVYFCFVILGTNGFSRNNANGFLSLAVVRVVASLGLGYMLAVFYEQIKNCKFLNEKKYEKLSFIIFSVMEIATLSCVVNWCLFHKMRYDTFIFIPIFVILIFSFVCQKGIISKLTNMPMFKYLGQCSYSIYVMQQFCFYFLGFSLWKNTEFVNNYVVLNLIISVVFSTILGIIVYYVFEKPITNKYKKSVTRQKGTIK